MTGSKLNWLNAVLISLWLIYTPEKDLREIPFSQSEKFYSGRKDLCIYFKLCAIQRIVDILWIPVSQFRHSSRKSWMGSCVYGFPARVCGCDGTETHDAAPGAGALLPSPTLWRPQPCPTQNHHLGTGKNTGRTWKHWGEVSVLWSPTTYRLSKHKTCLVMVDCHIQNTKRKKTKPKKPQNKKARLADTRKADIMVGERHPHKHNSPAISLIKLPETRKYKISTTRSFRSGSLECWSMQRCKRHNYLHSGYWQDVCY